MRTFSAAGRILGGVVDSARAKPRRPGLHRGARLSLWLAAAYNWREDRNRGNLSYGFDRRRGAEVITTLMPKERQERETTANSRKYGG
ncbi:hypothetical protein BaRGS_00033905 [Batillaria attramentaria]|uniref:Uncharacterized protein n=1 Tax=Batillaria attramentaria TaxID=370345 RepID=A0ABD0JIN2_9CAEN